MKKILILLLLIVISLGLLGQQPRDHEALKVIALYTGSIILEAAGDGLNDSGHKEWGHTLNAVSVGTLLVSPFIINYDKSRWYYYIASYTCLRISLFDPVYNMSRQLPINYIGDSSSWDKVMQKMNPPTGAAIFGRSVFFTVGVFIPINELGNRYNF
jgi:hypothetical protein